MSKVMKFGGTSVGSAENIKRVVAIVTGEGSTVTVLSAMSGTTDALVKISECAKAGFMEGVDTQIAFLTEKYTACADGLFAKGAEAMADDIVATFGLIYNEASNYKEGYSDRLIVAQGELLTSTMVARYMIEAGYNAQLLIAPEFMITDQEGKVQTDVLKKKLSSLATDSKTYYITQGFICTNILGEIDNLGRGGSDYSAALIGVAIGASEVQIWTDIDGMHNNDPRYVDNTHPIREMSFDEAAELAYFGAKILHPATIQPCKEANIPVRLKNTMDPAAPGTAITNNADALDAFHAVAAKDNITMIRITSARMLMAYGFMRKVFEVFENHRTAIDMITTSEVSVSLTIDNERYIEQIIDDLKDLGSIEVEKNNSIVCVVGRFERTNPGLAGKIFNCLSPVPIKMISYGASQRNMAMLINTEHKKKTLQLLNDFLFQ